VESATAAITKDVARAHQDLARISRVFFIPEHVNMAKAALLVKKPRLIMIQETNYSK
jgi:methylglyoxal synthase